MSFSSTRSALAFLTVIPVAARDGSPGERLGRAVFPAVGLLLGLVAWVALWAGSLLGGPLFGAVAALATLALLTGGLHLDGFADCADGLLATGSRESRLEIMRDPRLGAFGVIALVLLLLADAALLQQMSVRLALPALIVAGAVSRLAMVAVLVALPYIRPEGLGRGPPGEQPRPCARLPASRTHALAQLASCRARGRTGSRRRRGHRGPGPPPGRGRHWRRVWRGLRDDTVRRPARLRGAALSPAVPGTPHLYESVISHSRERRICTNA